MSESAAETYVVVGAALAGAKAVEAMRGSGFDGHVIMYGEERHLPYERPPLSKDYLMGNAELDKAFVHGSEWYDEQEVDLRLGCHVTSIDLAEKAVVADTGRQRFDKLLLTTGASARHLPLADGSGAPVAYLRSIEDSDRIKRALSRGGHVVIIGGGWIGLEVAAAARAAQCQVTILETLELPLLRVLGREVAEIFAALHRREGVELLTSTKVSGVEGGSRGSVVHLGDGSMIDADLVVVGVGVSPNTALAESAGLRVDNGIVVDDHLRASEPDVFAAGDVASAYHPVLQRHLRVEHWDNAIEQGTVAGRNMAGDDVAYERLPYFFTDQYDLGMEYVGNVGPDGYDEVVLRGDDDRHEFTAFWLKDSRVVAGMHVNDWDAIDPIRAIVTASSVDVAALRDESVPLRKIAEGVV